MIDQHKRETDHGTEYSDGMFWFKERLLCQHCADERKAARLPYRWANEQYSFGIYAGRYCEECWPKSGYRDATDPTARFDPADAGERIDADA